MTSGEHSTFFNSHLSKKYSYQNHCPEETFTAGCHKTNFLIWNLKSVPPIVTSQCPTDPPFLSKRCPTKFLNTCFRVSKKYNIFPTYAMEREFGGPCMHVIRIFFFIHFNLNFILIARCCVNKFYKYTVFFSVCFYKTGKILGETFHKQLQDKKVYIKALLQLCYPKKQPLLTYIKIKFISVFNTSSV